jgi:hypothetical protein
VDPRRELPVEGWTAVTDCDCLVMCRCVHSVCVVRVVKCRLLAAPRLRVFSVMLYAGYSAVYAVGWCGEWSCAGTVDMGVCGGVGRDGRVRAQCVGHGERCRLRAAGRTAPRLRGFPVLLYAGYSVVSAVGWCGAWGCVGTVDMGVRWWVGACILCGAWFEVQAARSAPPAWFSGAAACRLLGGVHGWCGEWGCVGTVDLGVQGVRRGGWVRAQCVERIVRCRLHSAPRVRGFPVLGGGG